MNYRPEYSHRGAARLTTRSCASTRWARKAPTKCFRHCWGQADLGPLKRLIIEKTEGNPFFMEEMIQVLFEEGALVRNGSIKLIKPLGELKIPPTVQAILASRIDRLPAEEKSLLQMVAVLGRKFALGLVKGVANAGR